MTSPDPLQGASGAPRAWPALAFKEDYARQCEAEFSAFYRENLPRLIVFMVWNGVPRALARDLAQESMIDAYRAWPKIEFPLRWVRRVASRKYARYRSRLHEFPVGDVPDSRSLVDPNDVLKQWEERLEILELLDELPGRQRQILTLSVLGYSPAEIAAELGISAEAVRGSLAKARRHAERFFKSREEGQ